MLTKEEAISKHRELWRWIAIETLRRQHIVGKGEYFSYIESAKHYCYCCEYTEQINSGCELCPIDWGSNNSLCQCMDKKCDNDNANIYSQWIHTYTYKEAALLAYKISKLPEKEFRFIISKRVITETQLRKYYKQVESYDTWEDWIYDLLNRCEIEVR